MKTLDILMWLYYRTVDPILARSRKSARLQKWGLEGEPRTMHLDVEKSAVSDPGLPELARFWRVASRYDMRRQGESDAAARLRATPIVVGLDCFENYSGFEACLRRQSSRTLSKIRRAARLGYGVKRFALPMHVHDLHAIKTSMAVRSGGPVLARWLLKPGHIAEPARQVEEWQKPPCPTHWTIWWGVFKPEPGHCDGHLQTDERLVAYVKLARCGDIVHYLDLMGHKEYLNDGVMILMHATIVSWLMESGEDMASGVRAVWYGAIEHGREGLLTWKRRAGFEPVRIIIEKPEPSFAVQPSCCFLR
jgi:hypothetical protein